MLFEFVLSLADEGDFGVRVENRGNAIVVDMAFPILNYLNYGDALLLRFVREHCPSDNVSYSVNVWQCRLELGIDLNSPGFILLNSNALEIQVFSIRNSSDGNHYVLSLKSGSLFSFFLSGGDFDSAVHLLMRLHLSVCQDLHSLLFQGG